MGHMGQIAVQAEQENAALKEALEKDLTALGYYLAGVREKMKVREDAIEEWFERIIGQIERALLPSHASDADPYVNRETSGTPVAPAGWVKQTTFEEGSITINALPGMSIYDLNDLVEDTMIKLLENN